jgi:hypothetical protein
VPDEINRTVALGSRANRLKQCHQDRLLARSTRGKRLTSDDFGRAFDETVTDLRSWLVARADRSRGNWRVRVKPVAVTACPFELILCRDRCFNLTIGGETYKDRVPDALGLFHPLFAAIVAGQVVTRTLVSLATGSVREVDIRVRLADDVVWKTSRKTALADVIAAVGVE